MLFLYMYGIGKAALMPNTSLAARGYGRANTSKCPTSRSCSGKSRCFYSTEGNNLHLQQIFAETGASIWLMYVAGATVLLASLVAITKDNLKARLAYSTVSQLSYVVPAGALATSFSLVGGAMHIAMHAFGKITLFFCAGAIMVATHKTEISQMRGLDGVCRSHLRHF